GDRTTRRAAQTAAVPPTAVSRPVSVHHRHGARRAAARRPAPALPPAALRSRTRLARRPARSHAALRPAAAACESGSAPDWCSLRARAASEQARSGVQRGTAGSWLFLVSCGGQLALLRTPATDQGLGMPLQIVRKRAQRTTGPLDFLQRL